MEELNLIKKFYMEQQAEAFKDYFLKFEIKHREDLLVLFMKWAESKDFSKKDKSRIWKLVKFF